MTDDKIKSKSIETGEMDYYEKIVDKYPLEEEYPSDNPPEPTTPTHLEQLSKFEVPFPLLPINPNKKSKEKTQPKIPALFKSTINEITKFKQEFYEYVCSESFKERNCNVKISPPDTLILYADTFDPTTINRINKLSDDWEIKQAMGYNEYNLMLKLKMR